MKGKIRMCHRTQATLAPADHAIVVSLSRGNSVTHTDIITQEYIITLNRVIAQGVGCKSVRFAVSLRSSLL